MFFQRPREPRRLTHTKARLLDGPRQFDVLIGNVSTGGLMAKCDRPPAKGAQVEIRHGGTSITGRVVWSKNRRFGLHSDDVIDIPALVPPPQPERPSPHVARRAGAPATRATSRPRPPAPARKRPSADKASLRDPIVAVLVATLTTSAVETGFVDFSTVWDTLQHLVHAVG